MTQAGSSYLTIGEAQQLVDHFPEIQTAYALLTVADNDRISQSLLKIIGFIEIAMTVDARVLPRQEVIDAFAEACSHIHGDAPYARLAREKLAIVFEALGMEEEISARSEELQEARRFPSYGPRASWTQSVPASPRPQTGPIFNSYLSAYWELEIDSTGNLAFSCTTEAHAITLKEDLEQRGISARIDVQDTKSLRINAGQVRATLDYLHEKPPGDPYALKDQAYVAAKERCTGKSSGMEQGMA